MWAALAAFEFIEKSEEAMSIVKDMSLAPSGLQKIQWVRDFMPALSGIEEQMCIRDRCGDLQLKRQITAYHDTPS